MLKKLFGKGENQKTIEIKAPVTGRYVELSDVPDPTFSEKMMGDGFAVEPSEGKVLSPIKGRIVQVFPTNHAVGIKSEEGLDVLIHIGLETVSLKGKGFDVHVKEGDKVDIGSPLVDFSLEDIQQEAKSAVTPLVLTEESQVADISRQDVKEITGGKSTVMIVTVK
ncbi:PTS sugar transporter subunit IIA [Salibacterium aidingense]|uniref:PTS sugar transporter subunit IIA n=1 Tax=Salibacterium aidingense TaxID=384933 RepID=UPI00041DB8F2|nr:PTS glucose transporter subunit IIA [Salibacterium aidingense]